MFETNPYFQPEATAPRQTDVWSQFDPLTVAAVVAVLMVVLMAGSLLHSDNRRRPARGRTQRRLAAPHVPAPTPVPDRIALRDPAQQMHAISKVGFATIPLLNRSEARLLPTLEKVVHSVGQGHRLMAQTSLGEILKPVGEGQTPEALDAAQSSINAKRLDFAVFNRFGHLVVAIEYQGHGHYHAQSFMRDAVKREALRKAGVPLLELPAGITPAEAASRLSDILARGAVAV